MSRAPRYLPEATGPHRPLTRGRPTYTGTEDGDAYQGPSRLGRRPRMGDMTGCSRPPYPQVNRRFGNNTRATVIGLRDTGILDNKYDKDIVQSHTVPPVIPASAVLGQDAAPSVLAGIRAFESGSHHWLFGS